MQILVRLLINIGTFEVFHSEIKCICNENGKGKRQKVALSNKEHTTLTANRKYDS